MPYTRNVPQAAQRISASQPQIQANFQEIDDTIQVDHVQFNDANHGKHKKLTMPVQGSDQNAGANELAFYTKNGITGNPELFLRRQNNASLKPITEAVNNGNTDGYSRLASGFMVKWGSRLENTGTQRITLPRNIGGATVPKFTSVFNIVITPRQNDSNNPIIVNFSNINLHAGTPGNGETFDIHSRTLDGSNSSGTFHFFIIGQG